MILFISDVHLGRGRPHDERVKERDVIACLRDHRDRVEHLYLLGDVFEEYIEYRHLVPKGYDRFKGLLAEWTDAGIPVTYLVGNHDPWHLDYFETELGIRVAFGDVKARHDGAGLYLSHGDRLAETGRAWLRNALRHPVPVWLYRNVLPGDAGMGIARYVNRRFGKRELDMDVVARLREDARRILREPESDVVILGHSHYSEIASWPEGVYMNTGYWHETRSFGRLVKGTIQLAEWNGRSVQVVQEAIIDG